MIANDFESFAFRSTAAAAALPRAAKVRAPRVAARLATLGVAESALAVHHSLCHDANAGAIC